MRYTASTLAVVLFAVVAMLLSGDRHLGRTIAEEPSAPALMPRVEDYTLMSRAEGFPSHTPSAHDPTLGKFKLYLMDLDPDHWPDCEAKAGVVCCPPCPGQDNRSPAGSLPGWEVFAC